MRAYLAEVVASGTSPIASIQSTIERHTILHVFFRMCSLLGDKYSYIAVLPGMLWSGHHMYAVQLILLVCLGTFTGNLIKNLLALPRPPAGREGAGVHLKQYPMLDYGAPSTHTLNAVTIPGLILYNAHQDSTMLWVLCTVWTLSIPFSRLYMGVHSPLDLLLGYSLGYAMLVFFLFWFWPAVLLPQILSPSPTFIPVCIALWVLALVCHPRSSHYSPSYHHSIALSSIFFGVLIGAATCACEELNGDVSSSVLYYRITVGMSTVALAKLVEIPLTYICYLVTPLAPLLAVTVPHPQALTNVDFPDPNFPERIAKPLTRHQRAHAVSRAIVHFGLGWLILCGVRCYVFEYFSLQ